jgi:DNA-directed RNA polymerase subunit RPC12/RpoP
MYFQMRLRNFHCPDCDKPFKSTSPNAVRCPKCSLKWSKKRNREYQKRRPASEDSISGRAVVRSPASTSTKAATGPFREVSL